MTRIHQLSPVVDRGTGSGHIANAAHDIRTPITGIIGAVEALDAGAKDVPDERDRFFAHISREADRLGRLRDSLLLLAQIESAGDIPLAPLKLRSLLEEVASGLQPEPDVRLIVQAPDSLATMTNRGLLERIIANLADNAVKHTRNGHIELRAQARDSEILIEGHNTGSGVSSDVAEPAFDRFYRADGRTAGGFGLGLSIASQAATALGATLTLEATPRGRSHRPAGLTTKECPMKLSRAKIADWWLGVAFP